MTIYAIKYGLVIEQSYDNVANLESFEIELDDTYEYWSYDKSDCENELEDRFILNTPLTYTGDYNDELDEDEV